MSQELEESCLPRNLQLCSGSFKWKNQSGKVKVLSDNYKSRVVPLEDVNMGRRFAMDEMLRNLHEKPICKGAAEIKVMIRGVYTPKQNG